MSKAIVLFVAFFAFCAIGYANSIPELVRQGYDTGTSARSHAIEMLAIAQAPAAHEPFTREDCNTIALNDANANQAILEAGFIEFGQSFTNGLDIGRNWHLCLANVP